MSALRLVLNAVFAAAALALTACGSDGDAEPTAAATATPAPTRMETPTPTPTEQATTTFPDELVGTWVSEDEGAAELVYVFSGDGTYKHAGVLLQAREAGLFSFTIEARGAVMVEGQELTLEPESGAEEIKDPDRGTTKRSPIDLSPQTYEWSLESSGSTARLRLTDESGSTISYRPE